MSETDAVRGRRAAVAFSPSRLMHDRDTDRSARIEQAWRLDDGSRVGCIVAGHAISLPADDPLVERFLAAGGVSWFNVFSEPSATRTPNRCGFALDSENSATPNLPVGLDINDWFVQV